MKHLRTVEANPHTKILAWWFSLTKREFEYLQATNRPNSSPSENSTVVTYDYGRWDLKDSKKFLLVRNNQYGTYAISYISFTDPTLEIQNLLGTTLYG